MILWARHHTSPTWHIVRAIEARGSVVTECEGRWSREDEWTAIAMRREELPSVTGAAGACAACERNVSGDVDASGAPHASRITATAPAVAARDTATISEELDAEMTDIEFDDYINRKRKPAPHGQAQDWEMP